MTYRVNKPLKLDGRSISGSSAAIRHRTAERQKGESFSGATGPNPCPTGI